MATDQEILSAINANAIILPTENFTEESFATALNLAAAGATNIVIR